MGQLDFFNLSDRYEQLSDSGDPLERLDELIDWQVFMPSIHLAFQKSKKSSAGRKPFNRLLMFKIIVLQSLYNLSDQQTEYQIKDRLSFMRFLGLGLDGKVPDEKTIWLFKEILSQKGIIDKLFKRFDHYLEKQGYGAACGTIIDASIVPAPRQRNSKDDNEKIKAGVVPESFKHNDHRLRQKDLEARWTKKQHQNYYGYKDHVAVDAEYKLIRNFEVTPANTADNRCFESLLEGDRNSDNKVWADCAYYSNASEARLQAMGYDSRVSHRQQKHMVSFSAADRANSRRSKIRKRVEHVFGYIQNSMRGKFVRCIGLIRAKTKIGLMNLVYNICRFEQLNRLGTV